MTLFIDVENKKLVQSLTSDRSVPAPVFMQGDNEPLEIFLLQKGGESLYKIKPLVVGTDFLRVAIARFKGYPKSLTYAAGYALNPNGGAEVVLPLNTTAIENAVQESEYITAFLEVEYSDTAGRIVTILQTACRVKNDLIENAPAVELQEQFYDRVYTDTVFSKKSANLSDLADKSASRKNLDVYAKSEVYNKSEVDTQEAKSFQSCGHCRQGSCPRKSRRPAEARPVQVYEVRNLVGHFIVRSLRIRRNARRRLRGWKLLDISYNLPTRTDRLLHATLRRFIRRQRNVHARNFRRRKDA